MSQQTDAFELHPMLARDCLVIGDLPLCRLLLMNDGNYPWCVLVPRRPGLRELYELDAGDVAQFWAESAALGRALMAHFRGDKFNVAALGNLCPQLHVHHIVRFTGDAAWPRPIWGVVPAEPYAEAAAAKVVGVLREILRADGLVG